MSTKAFTLARVLALTVATVASWGASAQGQRQESPWKPAQGDVSIQNFSFASGEKLATLKLHYYTLGMPRRDSSGRVINAIMLLHGTGGSGRGFTSAGWGNEVYAPGQPFDITKFFIVAPDDIGHGGSSKPSDGMASDFPKYTYGDMVKAEHALAEQLHLGELELIGGHSMGCMHTFMWGTMYPDAMKRLLPLACTPTAIGGRNRMFRKMLIESIRHDPAYQGGHYKTEPLYGIHEALFIESFSTSSPASLQRAYPAWKDVDEHVDKMFETDPRIDANDLIWMFEASRDYNPEPDLGKIKARLLWINSADDFVNPPDAGLVARMQSMLKPDQYRTIPLGPDTVGHGTTMRPKFWKEWVADMMREPAN